MRIVFTDTPVDYKRQNDHYHHTLHRGGETGDKALGLAFIYTI